MYKYNDIQTLEDFKSYIISVFPQININNVELITELFDIFKKSNTKRMRSIYDNMSAYLKAKRNGKGASVLSEDFWKSMGWTDLLEIQKHISKVQRERSKRCVEYYINQGYSEDESYEFVKSYQSINGKIANTKYTKEERGEQSVWSIKHWTNLGYSEEESKQKIRKYNASCKECYSNEQDFFDYKKKNSQHKKELYKTNPEKFWRERTPYSSKEETDFFNGVSKEIHDIQHLHFGINVQNTKLDELYNKQYIICDGYLKIDEKFIILEYDGTYWHDEKYDELRDEVIFDIRPDIIGIIRINDNFVRDNNLSIIKKEIEYAINDIKSKKCKKKCIYKS